jgi:hypothetical protein
MTEPRNLPQAGALSIRRFAGLVFDTVDRVYKGTGALRTTEEHAVRAEVVGSQGAGPVSANGFSYWSDTQRCRDARPPVKALVRRSIVTGDDAGQRVELRAWCAKDRNSCRYDRPTHRLLAYVVGRTWYDSDDGFDPAYCARYCLSPSRCTGSRLFCPTPFKGSGIRYLMRQSGWCCNVQDERTGRTWHTVDYVKLSGWRLSL